MTIYIGDYGINIQLVPLFGLALGINYYNPRLLTDETIEQDDFYHEIQFLLSVFAIRLELWKS